MGLLDLIRNAGYFAELANEAAVVATSAGLAEKRVRDANAGIVFELDVSAAASVVGDTLDVFVQTLVGGTDWVDVVHFTQVLGNGGPKRFFAKIGAELAEAVFENATALGAAAVRHLIGDSWRVRYAIAGAGTHTFSFRVTATPL